MVNITFVLIGDLYMTIILFSVFTRYHLAACMNFNQCPFYVILFIASFKFCTGVGF